MDSEQMVGKGPAQGDSDSQLYPRRGACAGGAVPPKLNPRRGARTGGVVPTPGVELMKELALAAGAGGFG